MSDFNGFPEEMILFFDGLEHHNTKAWFDAHRGDYEAYVKRPAQEFVVAMGEKLRQISPAINTVPKINKSLFRINRDTRFSADKRPYKTNLGIWFWEGNRKRMACSGFYFHWEGERLTLGAGIHRFGDQHLKRYRDAVTDHHRGSQLREVLREVTRDGYVIGGKHYKKVPRGYDASHENAEYLLYNGLYAMWETETPKEFHTKAIVDYVFSHFRTMHPLHEWLTGSIGL